MSSLISVSQVKLDKYYEDFKRLSLIWEKIQRDTLHQDVIENFKKDVYKLYQRISFLKRKHRDLTEEQEVKVNEIISFVNIFSGGMLERYKVESEYPQCESKTSCGERCLRPAIINFSVTGRKTKMIYDFINQYGSLALGDLFVPGHGKLALCKKHLVAYSVCFFVNMCKLSNDFTMSYENYNLLYTYSGIDMTKFYKQLYMWFSEDDCEKQDRIRIEEEL